MNRDSKALVILHDYFEYPDGGGRMCAILAESTQADLFYGFRSKEHPYFQVYNLIHHSSLSSRSHWPLYKQIKLSLTFKHATKHVREYTTAFYSGTYSPLAVSNHAAKRNLYYCHTPPRFIYDKREYYFSELPKWKSILLSRYISYLQPQFESAVEQMDLILANSTAVKNRIRHYLGKPSQVIYPPCETRFFTWKGQQKYYLSTARLDSLKQVGMCIEAFFAMPDQTLIVTSGGPEFGRLKQMAAGAANIYFTGAVSESRLRDLLGNAIATIYLAIDEDFGMSPVESMAAGKPVIGRGADGLLETILPGETGKLLSPEFDVQELITAVRWMTPVRAERMRSACQLRAQGFSTDRFLEQIYSVLGPTF